MVLREQCVNRMEGEGVTFVDSWRTYVFRLPMRTFHLKPVDRTTGAGKSTLLYVITLFDFGHDDLLLL